MITPCESQINTSQSKKLLAYTQTLHPKWTLRRSIGQQYKDICSLMHNYLPKFCNQYELYFELHASGNIHCHGILDIKDNIKRKVVLKSMTETIGNIVYKDITDFMKWHEYCTKDKEDMEKILKCKLPLYWCPNKKMDIMDIYTRIKKRSSEHEPLKELLEEPDV